MCNFVEHAADALVFLITNISHYKTFSVHLTKFFPMRVFMKGSAEMRQDYMSYEKMQKKGMIVL